MIGLAPVLLGVAAAGSPPWTVLQTDQVQVRCVVGRPSSTCEATATLDATVDQVCSVLENLPAYPDVFASVVDVTPRGEGNWAVEVDLPWPLAHWDLELRVDPAVAGPGGIGRHYRLANVGRRDGLWRTASWLVEPHGEGSRVVYSWDAPHWLLPSGAREEVLRRQGHNTVWAVALAAHTAPTAPESARAP